jgi:hypothetical protein
VRSLLLPGVQDPSNQCLLQCVCINQHSIRNGVQLYVKMVQFVAGKQIYSKAYIT